MILKGIINLLVIAVVLGLVAAKILSLMPIPVPIPPIPLVAQQPKLVITNTTAVSDNSRLLKSKTEELDSATAKLEAAESTIREQQSKIKSLSDGLDTAEKHEMDFHDQEFDKLKKANADLLEVLKNPVESQYDNLPDAINVAKINHRDVLLLIVGPGCPKCHVIEKTVLPNSDVKRYISNNLVLAVVDGSVYPQVAKDWLADNRGMIAYPGAFIYNVASGLQTRFNPPTDPATFLSTIKSL